MAQQFTISEYESFTRGKVLSGSGYIPLPEHTFDQLEQFILANRSVHDTEALELMSVSSRRGVGKIISAKNYIGYIVMNDGTGIEILPKIYSVNSFDKHDVKKIVLNMLRTVKDVPYKTFNLADLKTERMNIFEVFIRMFIDEVFYLVKRGLKSAYTSFSDNEVFLKGKILFPQHISKNHSHQERFYVAYDLFSTDRAENRLIKSTINYLQMKTTSTRNKKDLRLLNLTLEAISCSKNIEYDFTQYVKDRNTSDYDIVMKWCKVFLLNKSFSTFSGSSVAYALLFPMERLFESYIAHTLRKKVDPDRYTIKAQDAKYHLFNYPSKKFSLRPDIVITEQASGSVTVIDTKWKLLSATAHNYGISQADMYQMYAYQKKYQAKQVILLYPLTESMEHMTQEIIYESDDGAVVRVMFVDLLLNLNGSLYNL